MSGLEEVQIQLRAAEKKMSACSRREFRCSGWAGVSSDLAAGLEAVQIDNSQASVAPAAC